EADPVGILAQALVCYGNVVGGGPHYLVEGTAHHAKENVVAIGRTAGARKGTGFDQCRRLMMMVDSGWARDRIQGGLSSGEGIICAVRDRREELRPDKKNKGEYEMVELDPGVADKRLLCYEPELSRVLKVMSREGSTTSTIIRDAWDRQDLRVMTKTP